MQVTNIAGGGGGVAYAEVVYKRNDDNNLIVAASSATSTRLAQGAFPGNTMDQVRWIACVGADYGVIAVAKDSPDQYAARADGQDQELTRPRSPLLAARPLVAGTISRC